MLAPGKVKLPVATVIKSHGIKGELNVELTDYAEPEEDFAPGACLIAEIEGLDVPFFVASSRMRGAASALLTLDDVESDAEVCELVGHKLYVYVDRDEAEELTAGQLVGYDIVSTDGSHAVGRIADLSELTPGSWYFQLTDGRLIPAVDDFIIDVDHEARTVEMNLPEGLLEL